MSEIEEYYKGNIHVDFEESKEIERIKSLWEIDKQSWNEQMAELTDRIDKAIELLEPFVVIGNDVMFKGKMLEPVFEILKGEKE